MPDERPKNVVLIITDQERAPMHWPHGYADAHLPTRARLLAHGVNFTNATCNTSMCSPSRATILTGLMPAQHGVADTLTENGPVSPTETQLRRDIPNLATMLRAAGYDVHWRGKWHLNKGADGRLDPTPDDLAAYGFDGWLGPDAGGDSEPPNFGGGRANHDAHYIAQSLEFLEDRATQRHTRPFCLVVSLVNPHDVLAFPTQWSADYTANELDGDIQLPPSADEDLAANRKPSVHARMVPVIDGAVGAFESDAQRTQYANFYATLCERIDHQIAPIVDCFYGEDGQPTRLGEDTLIVRISDHGELAMSHGGLRQKAFNVYEETLRVPLIFTNPHLVGAGGGGTCPHPASLVDLVPTLAGLLGVTPPSDLPGADLSPLVRDPGADPVQEDVFFTFDDIHAGTGLVPDLFPDLPSRIRCIRERRYKYARYLNASAPDRVEFEMYDLLEDPDELENLAHPEHPRYREPIVVAERERLAARLAARERQLVEPGAADSR